MTDMFFEEVLQLAYEKEFFEFESVSEHKFSRHHNRQMKRIFKLYNENRATEPTFAPLKKRLLVAIIAIFAAVILAVTAVGIATNGFKFEEHSDYTKALAVGWENAPKKIEQVYVISVPEGYEQIHMEKGHAYCLTEYSNANQDTITFLQNVKQPYNLHYNTEGYEMEELNISRNSAFFIQWDNSSTLFWDNGDYILEICSTLSKELVVDLANTAKLKNN